MNSSKEHSNIFSSILSQSIEDKGHEDYVMKLSNGKCFFNRRYLVLRNGVLSYYREKPSEFVSIAGQPQKPKGKVHVLDSEIKKVDSSFSKKKNNPFMFQIAFNASNKKKKTFWVFSVGSQDALSRWLEAFERIRNPVLAIDEEKDEVSESVVDEKEIEFKEEKEKQLREENFKKTLELERLRSEKKQKEAEEQKKKEEAEKESKKKLEEKKRKQFEKAEKRKKEANQKVLESYWDYNFQNLLNNFLNSESNQEIIETGLDIFRLIGSFKEAAIYASKIVINEIQLPIERRKIRELGNSTYVYQNLMLNLSWEKTSCENSKYLGHEFRAGDVIHDALFFLSRSNPSFGIRANMMCVVDFKGFRAYVTSIIPLDTQLTVIHGLKTEDYYQSESSLYTTLSNLAQVLNLKQHVFQWENGIVPVVHLSVYTQLHESLGYSEIENIENSLEGKKYIYMKNLAEILPIDMEFNKPPQNFANRLRPEFFNDYSVPLSSNGCINLTQEAVEEDDFEICEASLKVRTDKVNEIVELLDSLTIMPIDSKSLTQALHANGINCRYLGLIVHRTALPHIKDLCTVEILARTCKRLLFQHLADLMTENNEEDAPDNLKVSYEHENTKSIKNIEGNYYADDFDDLDDFSITEFNVQNPQYRKSVFKSRYNKQLRYPSYKILKNKLKEVTSPRQNLSMEGSLKECIVDYINLVFGAGEESDYFWEKILTQKASQNFHITAEKIEKTQINLHALLHAINYHCGIQLAFSKETMLGKILNPFTLQSLERIKEKTKTLAMKGIESRVINARLQQLGIDQDGLETSLVCLEINKALNNDPEYLGDPALLSDIGEIMLEKHNIEGAIKYAKDALFQTHPLHAEGVKSWCILIRAMMENSMQDEALQCFDHALTALEYHWGPYHPLHCTLYSILAFLYMKKSNLDEALILYKNSLMCSLRVLGPNHPHTAEIYVELGNLYVQQRSLIEATSAIEKGFSVYEAALGPNAVVTVTAGVKLSQLYIELGKIDKALLLIKNALIVHEKNIEELLVDSDLNYVKINHHYDKIEEILNIALSIGKNKEHQETLKKFREKNQKVKEDRKKIKRV